MREVALSNDCIVLSSILIKIARLNKELQLCNLLKKSQRTEGDPCLLQITNCKYWHFTSWRNDNSTISLWKIFLKNWSSHPCHKNNVSSTNKRVLPCINKSHSAARKQTSPKGSNVIIHWPKRVPLHLKLNGLYFRSLDESWPVQF